MDKKKLAYIGLGAVLLYLLLKPKAASASTLDQRANAAQKELEDALKSGGSVETFKDPATGVTLVGPSEPIQTGVSYTVRRGESWSNIAARTYGDYRWWPFLWDANRTANRFTSPDSLAVGDVISIPSAPPASAEYRTAIFRRTTDHANYWKRTAPRGQMPASVLTTTQLP